MSEDVLASVQQRVSAICVPKFQALHSFKGVPDSFLPWESNLSPSALYSCSLRCRKQMGYKAPEVKWMSIRRWITTTPQGVRLPPGVFFSIKRHERYSPLPEPQFIKTDYVLLMMPYGNVWSQSSPGVPMTEDWLWQDVGGKLILERLMMRDAAFPVLGYYGQVHAMLLEELRKQSAGKPHVIGIHLKRKNGREVSERP